VASRGPARRPGRSDHESGLIGARGLRTALARAVSLVLKGALVLIAVWLGAVAVAIVTYRYVDPPATSLTVARWLTGRPVAQTWLPIERISPNLVRAVITSEDSAFCSHRGIDLAEIEAAIERAQETDDLPRGASTISMQVTKNLFLWPAQSYVRKAIELPLTLAMEVVLPKRRIAEIYLNIAEWGPGVFGAEAAARHHFGKSANALTARESAQMAAALPNPIVRNAGRPGPRTRRVADIIERRARNAARHVGCVLGGPTR